MVFQLANRLLGCLVLLLLSAVSYNSAVIYKGNLSGTSNISVNTASWVREESNPIELSPIPLFFFHHCLKTFEIGPFSLSRVVKQDLTLTFLSLSGKSPVIDSYGLQTWATSTLHCRDL